MTRDDTRVLLLLRRDLTGEQFNDGTIDAWAEALEPWSAEQCRRALIRASREDKRISVAQVVHELPAQPRLLGPMPEPLEEPEAYSERGRRWLAMLRATHPTLRRIDTSEWLPPERRRWRTDPETPA